MTLISIVTPCFNEEENVANLYEQVKGIFACSDYDYEHIFIDNASTDKTTNILKQIASHDSRVKIIINTRNFGHIRSPFYAMLQAHGEAIIPISADLQEPPSLILEFLEQWRAGYKIVAAVRKSSQESWTMATCRRLYYGLLTSLAEIKPIKNFSGFGLYDRAVINHLKALNDANPYFRGLISELGYPVATVYFNQPVRIRGLSKNNLYTLYDMAALGISNYSKIPLRLPMAVGILGLYLCVLICSYYGTNFLLNRQMPSQFVIYSFYFLICFSLQFVFMGMLGEYILSIQKQVFKRPLIIESERVNF